MSESSLPRPEGTSTKSTATPKCTYKLGRKKLLAVVVGIALVSAGVAVGVIFGLRSTVRDTAGVRIFSSLGSEAADMVDIIHYASADLGAWLNDNEPLGLKLDGMKEINVFLAYDHYAPYTTPAEKAANEQMFATIPAGLRGSYLRSGDSGDGPPVSPCVCGDGNAAYVTLYYPKFSKGRRVKLAVHEWYHLLQLTLCDGGKFAPAESKMAWMDEGTAAFLEHMYAAHYGICEQKTVFSPRAANVCGMDTLKEFIEQTRKAVQSGSLSYSTAQEAFSGLVSNYPYAQTAVAYLVSRTSLKTVLKTFLTSGKCKALTEGSSTFQDVFGMSKTSFYADLTSWLQSSAAIDDILPSLTDIAALFGHNTLCSHSCSSATNDGVCDSSCPLSGGSDCADCGPSSKPDGFPITFSPVQPPPANNRQLVEFLASMANLTSSSGRRRLVQHPDGLRCIYLNHEF